MQGIGKYEILLLDAANTIIHKPDIWPGFLNACSKNGFDINEIELRKKHKLLSEIIHFPDVTSKEFYSTFNNEVLLSLGIIASQQLLDDIFTACTYLPWKPFEDTIILNELTIKKAVLSNFNSSLKLKIRDIFGENMFDNIIGSEDEGIGKPNVKFYLRALDLLNVEPEKVLYIGDSLKLDVIPAQSIGIDAWLVDRDRNFTNFNKRIDSLSGLSKIIN